MSEKTISIVALIIALIFILWLYIFLPAKMARKRGRSKLEGFCFFGLFLHFGELSCCLY